MLTDTVSPLSFLKNPMILMAVVSMGLMFGMPKIMENSKLQPSLRRRDVILTRQQWTQRRNRNSKRCRRPACSDQAPRTPPRRSRTSTSRPGWLERPIRGPRVVAARAQQHSRGRSERSVYIWEVSTMRFGALVACSMYTRNAMQKNPHPITLHVLIECNLNLDHGAANPCPE
jgi:hypothetical protein